MLTQFAHIENRSEGGLWWRIPAVLVLWSIVLAPVVAAIYVASTVRGFTRELPAVPRLSSWRAEIPQSSVIVASDGSVLAELPFTDGELIGHRSWARFDELPQQLINAFLAAEDERFVSHQGVDFQAIARAALANYRAGEVVEGASTITQQLARNLLPEGIGDERSARRKVREAIMARRFERLYSKQEILEAYVNLVFLGAQSYGVKAAARRYFDKQLAELTIAEASLIAGLAQAPGRADPTIDSDAARARRDEVITRSLSAGFITQQQADIALAGPVTLRQPRDRFGTLSPWQTERVRQILESEHADTYHRGGLRVETTVQPALDMATQQSANARVQSLTKPDKQPQAAAVLIDYQTGYVDALVGGHSFSKSVFNRALQACRQPGSAFKPVLYGAALERDAITPGTALRDGPIAEWDEDLKVHWKPQNSGRTFRGVAIAADALASSLNAPAVDVLDRVGGRAVIEFARRLGITTKMVDVGPLALGSSCVIPFELTVALAAIANRGATVTPTFIKQIRRDDVLIVDNGAAFDPGLTAARRLDRIAAEAAGPGADSVLDEDTAFMLTTMLRGVVTRGTATAARAIGRPAAGKTGTTNDNSDAWFVGFTGRVVGSVWIGHDNPADKLPSAADGARGALPVWVKMVRAAEGKRAAVPVPGEPPDGVVAAQIDRETGLLAERGAGGSIALPFRRGTAPTESAGTRPDLPKGGIERVTREF